MHLMETYLLRLMTRLFEGIARVPDDVRALHAAYLQSAQNADGGFSGREGGSDLYYTGFALRGLALLDALTPELSERTAGFLRQSLSREASVIDLFSLLYSALLIKTIGGPDALAGSPADWPERVTTVLETFRTADGGYGKTAGAASGSTYHTFLVALCYELLDRPLPRPAEVVRFVQSRRREDGGYVEIAPMRRSGTNPTAAAVGVLQMLQDDLFSSDSVSAVIDFLAEMPSLEGGLRANARVPLADLLSTFTGLWTLDQLGALSRIDPEAARAYAESLQMPSGGFRGGLWDERADVEYTFYGLGTLALLS
jgi:geranylgeranyl transferase type-2 subunit beta